MAACILPSNELGSSALHRLLVLVSAKGLTPHIIRKVCLFVDRRFRVKGQKKSSNDKSRKLLKSHPLFEN